MKKIAIVGTQGVPAKYGGFETLVENIIGDNCSPDVQYTVFSSSKDFKEQRTSYKGAILKYIPLHANGAQSTPYDILSLLKTIRGYDVILVLGVSGCAFLPIFRLLCRKKLIVNIDGLEHRRAKWKGFAKYFLRFSEKMAVECADVIVSDNKGIQDYVTETYAKDSELIAYGGDHVLRNLSEQQQETLLSKYMLAKDNYSFTVCRIEPENNCHVTLQAFAKSGDNLVFVGNWEKSEYGKELKAKYADYANISILDSIYDLDELYALRNNCKFYIHGHSAGGTNPSLVEAMHFGRPVIAYDVVYNRETTENKACYFNNASELIAILGNEKAALEESGKAMKEIANRRYLWSVIAKQYEDLY